MSIEPVADSFVAWINLQSGASTLHVTGSVTVPTSGWSGTLTEAVPQGINPDILILDAKLTKPSGVVLEVLSKLDLSFEKSRSPHYQSVTVRGLGDDITVEVTEAH